jgi:hypothetical protein
MPEIRFNVTKKLDDLIKSISNNLGVDKSEYVKSLILSDLRLNKNGKKMSK